MTTELERLEHERDTYANKMAIFMLELVFILGIPAGLAAYLGEKVIGSREATFIGLGIAFILSWTFILRRFFRTSQRVSEIERRIKKLKEKQTESSQ